MKKIVEIVIIPSPSCATWIWKDGEDMFYTGKEMPTSNQLYQQMLVLSDDALKEGDTVYAITPNISGGNIVATVLHIRKDSGWYGHIITNKCQDNRGYAPGHLKKIVASYPQIEGTLPISQEFVQQYVQSQGKGVVYIETEEKCVDVTEPVRKYYNETTWIEMPKIDKAGNAILSIEQEVTDPLSKGLGYIKENNIQLVNKPPVKETTQETVVTAAYVNGWDAAEKQRIENIETDINTAAKKYLPIIRGDMLPDATEEQYIEIVMPYFKVGWSANPAQYTEEDLENLLRWATNKYANDRAFGWYLPGTGYRPNSSNVVEEWVKEHKQSKNQQ